MRALLTIAFLTPLLLAAACGGSGGPPTNPETPTPDTLRTITGRIAYFTTGPAFNLDASGRLIPGTGFVEPTFPRPAPRFPVEVLTPGRTVIGQGLTDDAGNFSINVNFGPVPATQVIVRVRAQLNLPFGTIVRVLRNAAATVPYSHESAPGGNPADKTMVVDLAIQLGDGAAAYHILDTLYEGFLEAKSGILASMPPVDILYEPGNGDRSFLVADAQKATITVAGGLPGDPTSNQDGWDPAIIMRLMGEYLLAYFFPDAAPPGTPSDALLVPSSAWREGFLDFWACMGRGSPRFWDTTGIGPDGRVVRFFSIESFFNPALGSLGPDDPNVYQGPALTGIGSRFTVAEMLWDIHDSSDVGADEGLAFPLFLTLRFLEQAASSTRHPYLISLFDAYAGDGSLDPVTLDILTRSPEEQGFTYPASVAAGTIWPTPFFPPGGLPNDPLIPPVDLTLSDTVDTMTEPVNVELGLLSVRYFTFKLAQQADVTASLTTSGSLIIEILDFRDDVVAAGTVSATALALAPETYTIRVRSAADPQIAPFDLRLVANP